MKRVLLVLLVSWMGLAQAPIQRNPWSTNRTGDPVLGNNNLIVTNVGTGLDWMFHGTSTSRVARIADFPIGLMVGTNATQFRVPMTGDTTGTNYIAGPIVGDASATNANVLGQVTANKAVVTNTVGIGGSVSPQALLDVGPAADGTNAVRINGGVQTGSSRPALEVSQTWNNAATSFKGVRAVVTNTASASGSRPFEVYGGAAGATRLHDVDSTGNTWTLGTYRGGYLVPDFMGYAIVMPAGTKLRFDENGGMQIQNAAESSVRFRIYGTPKTTPMGATTSVVKIGLTGTPAAAATNCFVGGLINYTIQNTHTGGAGVTNAIEVGNGTLRYNGVAVNDLGGGGRYVYLRLMDTTNASWSVGANTFGWTWNTNAVDATSFTLCLTPTNTVVNRATTETCTVTYSVIQDSAQLITPL